MQKLKHPTYSLHYTHKQILHPLAPSIFLPTENCLSWNYKIK